MVQVRTTRRSKIRPGRNKTGQSKTRDHWRGTVLVQPVAHEEGETLTARALQVSFLTRERLLLQELCIAPSQVSCIIRGV